MLKVPVLYGAVIFNFRQTSDRIFFIVRVSRNKNCYAHSKFALLHN